MRQKGGSFHDLILMGSHNYDYYTFAGVEDGDTLGYCDTDWCNVSEKYQDLVVDSFAVVEVDDDDFVMPAN